MKIQLTDRSIQVGDADISHLVSSVYLCVEAGRPAMLHIDVNSQGFIFSGEANVSVSPELSKLLHSLGWLPPEGK